MNSLNLLKIYFFIFLISITYPVFAHSILSPLTDSVNSGIINTKMDMDERLNNVDIDATVINGIAVFSGVVHNHAELQELFRIARSVSGIKGIDVTQIRMVDY